MTDTDPDFPITRWARKADLIQAAISYEEAWTAAAHWDTTPPTRDEHAALVVARAHAHQALLDAARALKEYS